MKNTLTVCSIAFVCMFVGCNKPTAETTNSAKVEPPTVSIQWKKTFGGSDSDEARYMIPTSDGKFLVCGWTTSQGNGERDAWVFCVDESGEQLWEKTFGGKENDEASFISARKEGGYIVCGLTASQGNGESDAWVFAIDGKGEMLWEQTYGGEAFDRADAIGQASDGGYLLTGGTRSKGAGMMDAWVLRIDKNGKLISDATLGGEKFDRLSFLGPTNDGGFIACGQTGSKGSGGLDFWVVRFDDAGEQLWEKTYGNERDNWCECIVPTADGGFMASGETKPAGSHNWDAWIVRLDKDGNKLWDNTFGAHGSEWFNTVTETSDNGFIFCGVTESIGGGGRDVWIVRTDANGKLVWHQPFGGEQLDNGYAIHEISAGQFVACARTASAGNGKQDAWVLRFNDPK